MSDMNRQTDILRQIWEKTSTAVKTAFFSGLFFGIITHLFMITNKITNWDDVTLIPGTGGSPYYGRWFIDLAHRSFSVWGAPGINGMCAVIFLVLTACWTVSVLRIRSMTGAALTAALIVTFPGVTSTLTFMYAAPVYCMAMMMEAMAVWCTVKFRFGWIPAVLLHVFAMAVYQAYYPFAVGLSILAVIYLLIAGEKLSVCVKRGVQYLAVLAAGMAAYLFSIKLSGYQLDSYRGMNEIGHTAIRDYLVGIVRAYHRILEYYVTDPASYMKGPQEVINWLLAAVLAVLAVAVLIRSGIVRSAAKSIIYLVLLGLMPLAMGLIFVMSTETQDAAGTMIFPYCLFYLTVLFLAEHLTVEKAQNAARTDAVERASFSSCLMLTAMLLLAASAFCNYRTANNAYFRSYIAQKRIDAFYNRIMSRVEQQDGYQYGQQVAIIGDWWPDPNVFSSFKMDQDNFADLDGVAMENGLFSTGVRPNYIRMYLGIWNSYLEDDEKEAIVNSDAFKEMPVWPAEGCIKKIGDNWVVKITDRP